MSTRRVEDLVAAFGIERISKSQVSEMAKSQVSEMAKSLDETVEAFRTSPLDQGPCAYLWVDALVLKSREVGGRAHIAGVVALVATAVNAQGYRGMAPPDGQ